MKIRVAIADDHQLVSEGISTLLHTQKEISVTAVYHTGAGLLEGLKQQQPDVLLLDIQFPDCSGNELIRIIGPAYPDMRVIVVSSIDNVMDIKDMMKHGCSGYILKNVAFQVLVEAIHTVFRGGEYIDPDVKEQLYKSLLHPGKQKAEGNKKLTLREQKILELIAQGRTNVEIAGQLFLSYRTIQNNRLTLYQKFGVHNTAELIKVAIQLGHL